ncbi:CD225/dispanin family protein [Nocardiopsis sp. CT-R113]|uniref:CD225/dispanin family protein n=1 Tax=Nocardiopsis codii TaxID=3065942 RepID=A0ABU7K8B9_9ACTN|nr:CD225/dispanin family protein [Nocardiopsis sp. CT-R113]MEE2038484.1 CD225/dispanin family protein [Nocardiopsis sp. CT-R113]
MSYGPPPPGGYGPPTGGYGPPAGYGGPPGYGPPGHGGPPAGDPPKNHLVMNILGIISCFPVFGIIGLIFAIMVNGQWSSGDYRGAESSSGVAKTMGIIGLVFFVPGALYALFMIVMIVALTISEI